MEKEVITTKHAVAIMVLYMLGSSLIHGINLKAKQDFWVAYPFVIVITLFAFLMFSRILILYPRKNLLDIVTSLFGRIVGSILYGAIAFYAFSVGAIVIRQFSEFIQTVHLPETPQYAFAIIRGR